MEINKSINEAREQLSDLYYQYGDQLQTIHWNSGHDNWKELLICLLHQLHPEKEMTVIRLACDHLQILGLLEATGLSHLISGNDKYGVIKYVFENLSYSQQEATNAIELMICVSRDLGNENNYILQRLLRQHFEEITTTLSQRFSNSGLEDSALRSALIHWLQNSFNAPLILSEEPARLFREKHAMSEEDLFELAEELKLSHATLDDLLSIHNLSQSEL